MAIVYIAAVNSGVHVSFRIIGFSRCMPRSGIAGLYGSSVFRFRSLHFDQPPTPLQVMLTATQGHTFGTPWSTMSEKQRTHSPKRLSSGTEIAPEAAFDSECPGQTDRRAL